METFYIIVLSVAVGLLILLLTYIGIKMAYYRTSGSNPFPPISSSCPDNWVASDTKGNCIAGNINISALTKTNTPFGFISNKQVNFQDPGWSTGGTRQCNLKKWANTNNITWDGVTNYNGCS